MYDDMGKAATVLLFSIPTCSVHWFNIHYTCITKYMVLDHQKFWSHMSGIVGWVTGAIWTASQNI